MKKAAIRFTALMLALVLTLMIPSAGMQTARADFLTILDGAGFNLSIKNIRLLPSLTEGEVWALIRENISSTTEGARIDTTNTWLGYLDGKNVYGVGLGTNKVNAAREYYVMTTFRLENDYGWNSAVMELDHNDKPLSSVGFSVYFNGSRVTNGFISYNRSYNSVQVSVPVANDISAAKLKVDLRQRGYRD